jgi:hypothetical protein
MTTTQVCPVCQVSINNDVVHFASGNPGTRARLYARVCQYVNKKECINQNAEKIGPVTSRDNFSPARPIAISQPE